MNTRISFIQEEVAWYFGTDAQTLRSRVHSKTVTLARHVAMTLVQRLMGLSPSEIAKAFGRTHWTVREAIERLMGDPNSMLEVLQLEEDIIKKGFVRRPLGAS